MWLNQLDLSGDNHLSTHAAEQNSSLCRSVSQKYVGHGSTFITNTSPASLHARLMLGAIWDLQWAQIRVGVLLGSGFGICDFCHSSGSLLGITQITIVETLVTLINPLESIWL